MRELFFQIQNTQLYSCLAENIESEDAQGPLICIFCMFFMHSTFIVGIDFRLLPVFWMGPLKLELGFAIG